MIMQNKFSTFSLLNVFFPLNLLEEEVEIYSVRLNIKVIDMH